MNLILFLIASFLPLTFVINGQKIIVNDERINSINYIRIDDLAKIICPNSDCEVNFGIISHEKFTLKTSSNSFYIVFQTIDTLQIGQMTAPALISNNQILIPLNSILNVLQGLNLLDYEINKHNILVSGRIFDLQMKFEFKKEIEKFPKIIPIQENTNNPIFPIDTSQKKPTNTYEVPKKLKRKGIK